MFISRIELMVGLQSLEMTIATPEGAILTSRAPIYTSYIGGRGFLVKAFLVLGSYLSEAH